MKGNATEPIRIAQIIGKWVGGGVEAVVMNYYRHIDRSKIQFDFICDEDSTNIPYEEIEALGGKVILIPPYQKVFKYHKELKRVLKEGKYKIVHSHINTLSVFSLWAAKSAGVPVRIAHNHATTNGKEFKRNIIKQILRPFSKLYATNYMCCSEMAGRWLFGNKEYEKGDVFLLKNAIDTSKFAYNEKERNKIRQELNIKDNQIVVGHVGRMVDTKNHTFLLDVFSNMSKDKDSVLLMIGQGPLEKDLKNKVKDLGIEDRVYFMGQQSDIEKWYQAFDVLVLPSLYEGFGLTLLEAQASNLPCLASDNIPIEANITNDSFCFLSLNDHVDEWVKSIVDLYNSGKRKDNSPLLKLNGYDIKDAVKNLENIYYNAIGGDDNA